jgi:hypothetical protein
MAGVVVNIKVCIPLKLRSGLTGNYHAICHYSYNLPLATIFRMRCIMKIVFATYAQKEKQNLLMTDFELFTNNSPIR